MDDHAAQPTDPVIRMDSVSKEYPLESGYCLALDDVSLRIGAGEFVAIVGRSGSGKTTLLNLLAGIDVPTRGEIEVGGATLHDITGSALSRWRGRSIGLVFQFFQLLPTLTVVENVMLPMDFLNETPRRQRRSRALELLGQVGIVEQADKLPSALSGGQQQRAAIARALANDPPVVLADEPTGNLDSAMSDQVLELFAGLAEAGKAVVMVTHERDVARFTSREVTLSDGRVVGDHARAMAVSA